MNLRSLFYGNQIILHIQTKISREHRLIKRNGDMYAFFQIRFCQGYYVVVISIDERIQMEQIDKAFKAIQSGTGHKEMKSTQSQLKDVEKLLKLDPTNTELLSQKQKLLTEAVSETKEKLETLKTAA